MSPSPVAAVGVTGAALSALVTWYSLGVYLPSLNTPHTALEGVAHEASASPPSPGLARRLSFIVIDGLSYGAARSLEELGPLRRGGVLRSLAVEFPSFTSPALVSMMTGVGPRDSGTRRNGDLGGVRGLDSILIAAHDAGVPIRIFGRGYTDVATILAPPPGTPFLVGRFAPAVDIARRGLAGADLPAFDGKSPIRALDVVHCGNVDDAGHLHGGVSAEYRAEAKNAAAYVARYARSLDLAEDALVVVSDHGHVPEGGHGGDEPSVSHAFFLAAGGLFRRGVELGERPMRDVASTLAVVGGLRVPSSNLGLPMLDALSLDDLETSFLMAAPFDEASRFLCAIRPSSRCAEAAPLVARLKKPDPDAWEEAVALHAALSAARERDLDARRAAGGPRRLAAAVVLLALAASVGLRALARRRVRLGDVIRPPALLLPVVLAGVYAGALAARGYRPSFSHLMPIPIFAADATPSGLVAVAAVLLLAWGARPGPSAPWVLLAGVAAPFAMLAAWAGADTVTPPPNVAGVLVFLLGPAVPSAAVAAVVLAWIATKRREDRASPPPATRPAGSTRSV